MIEMSVVLPQPEGPTSSVSLAVADFQIDAAQGQSSWCRRVPKSLVRSRQATAGVAMAEASGSVKASVVSDWSLIAWSSAGWTPARTS